MMKRILLAALTLTGGCAPTRTLIEPTLALTVVERPADVAERWGDFTLAPADSSSFTYEDELLRLAVVPLVGSFSMVLENRSDYSIRFLWPFAAYVGPNGVSSSVVSGETRWFEINTPPTPQVIPSASLVNLVILPRANANTSTNTIDPFFPASVTCEEARSLTLRLVLPVEIQGVTNEYSLHFTPSAVEQVTYQQANPGLFAETDRLREISRESCP